MLLLISPAKTLDFETSSPIQSYSQPDFLADSEALVKQLRKLSAAEISTLMKISEQLGKLNSERFQTWQGTLTDNRAKQALLAFQGDVYQGMQVERFESEDFDFAQSHLRILSGLYGVLRPLDLIQPYRLEMGTKLANPRLKDLSVKNLYEFWADKPTHLINQQLAKLEQKTIINLASDEYFKVIKPKLLKGEVFTPVFKDWKNDQYKIISFYAKKARGMMAAYIIKNRLHNPEELKGFAEAGYSYNQGLSTPKNFVFTRQLFDFNF